LLDDKTITIDGVEYPAMLKTDTNDQGLKEALIRYNNSRYRKRPQAMDYIHELTIDRLVNKIDVQEKPITGRGLDINELAQKSFVEPHIIQILYNQDYLNKNLYPDLNANAIDKIETSFINFRLTGDIEDYNKTVSLLQIANGTKSRFDSNRSILPKINENLSPDKKQEVGELIKQFIYEEDENKRDALYTQINEINNSEDEVSKEASAEDEVSKEASAEDEVSQGEPAPEVTTVDEFRPAKPFMPLTPPTAIPPIEEVVTVSQEPTPEVITVLKPYVRPVQDPNRYTPGELEQRKQQRRYAILSQVAYDSYYTSPQEAELKMQQYLPNHHILDQYTSANSTVIEKITDDGIREIIIANRGTDPTNAGDLVADAMILAGNPLENLGFSTGRFREYEDLYLRIKNDYPDAKIILTGHSLAGRGSLMLGEKYNEETQVFNVGSSPVDLLIPSAKKNPKIKIYNTPTDVISISNRYDTNQEVIDVSSRNSFFNPLGSHTLDNFMTNRVLARKGGVDPNFKKRFSSLVGLPKDIDKKLDEPSIEPYSKSLGIAGKYGLGNIIRERIPSNTFTTPVLPKSEDIDYLDIVNLFYEEKDKPCVIDPKTLKKTCQKKKSLQL